MQRYRLWLSYSINRNIVECKGSQDFVTRMGIRFVLIETLWNVKLKRRLITLYQMAVLIETLWNVKTIVYGPVKVSTGINRNIVECKVE